MEWPAGGWTTIKCCARSRSVGIGVVALRVIPRAAVGAVAATNGRRHDYTISWFEVAHRSPNFFYHSNAFMPQDGAGGHAGHGSSNHVQVCPADGAGGQPDNRIVRLVNFWFRNVFQSNVTHSSKDNSFHHGLLNQ